MTDIGKIAALAMLSVEAQAADTLSADVAEILQMGRAMPARETAADVHTVCTEALRDDTARVDADGAALLSLSKKARDGYIVVSRTVGGEV